MATPKKISEMDGVTTLADGDKFPIYDASDTSATKNITYANLIAALVKKDGSVAMTGDFDMGSNNIVNLANPSSDQDAATKVYVDEHSVVTVGTATGADYVCDGTADDVQINAAITAVNTAGGGIVFLKAGTYSTDATVTLKTKVYLVGEGQNATVITPSGNYNAVTLDDNSYSWKLFNLKIDGTNQTSTAGIKFNNTTAAIRHAKIVDCYLYNCYNGILDLDNTNYNYDIKFEGLDIWQTRNRAVQLKSTAGFIYFRDVSIDQTVNDGCVGAKMWIDAAAGITLDKVSFTAGQGWGLEISNSAAIWVSKTIFDTLESWGAKFDTCYGIHISDSYASLCGEGFLFDDTYRVTMTGGGSFNCTTGSAADGIAIAGDDISCVDYSFCGVHADGNGRDGFRLQSKCLEVAISGCVANANTGVGINEITGVSNGYNCIMGNVARDNGTNLTISAGTTIGDNTLNRA